MDKIEQQIENQLTKAEQPIPDIPFIQMFRFTSKKDKALLVIGGICAFLNGSAYPCYSIIYGMMINSLQSQGDDLLKIASDNSIYLLIIGLGTFILSFFMFSIWMIVGERQGIQLRIKYFEAIIKQEIGWFDIINPNQLSNKVASESFDVQGAIGEKAATFIMTVSWTFFGFFIGFIQYFIYKLFKSGWQLALVVTASLPGLSIFTGICAVVLHKKEIATSQAYNDAGGYAEQAINAIKTVKMLDGEDLEYFKYSKCLFQAAQVSIKYQIALGFSFGLVFGGMIWCYALGFYYGAKLLADQVFIQLLNSQKKTYNSNRGQQYISGDVVIIFYAVLNGGYALGQVGPCIQYFSKGKAAASKIFYILDRKSQIVDPAEPQSLNDYDGSVQFKNVSFNYPNKKDINVLQNITFDVPKGKKVAFVGESGCGKSTIIQLIERFYDCDNGEIILGNCNIKDLKLKELRQNIGYVGQEPVLFATSIRENLLYSNPQATEEEIISVLKKVNAWEFIEKLDKGLETYVGVGGQQLSGGQKQRIAIARAIIKKPKLLLLDEATSALDRQNEKLIQTTLDQISQGITTITVAHRLKTIQNADIIYVIQNGRIIEYGSHNDLLKLNGKYYSLVQNQLKIIKQDLHSLDQIDNSNIIKAKPNDQQTLDNLPFIQSKNFISAVQEEYERAKNLELLNTYTQIKQDPILLNDEENQLQNETQINTDQKNYSHLTSIRRLFEINKEERFHFILGIVAAIVNGCTMPFFALFFSKIMKVLLTLSNPDITQSERQEQVDSASEVALWFFLIGIGTVILTGLQNFLLAYTGEQLTLKLRQLTYKKILSMPISFFDNKKYNPSNLNDRLQQDCKLIQGLTSTIIGVNLQNIGALLCGLGIAFEASWVMALLILVMQPISYFGFILQAKFVQGFSDKNDQAYSQSSLILMEAVTNIRTISSFANDEQILKLYSDRVQIPLQRAKQMGISAGLSFGISQMQGLLTFGLQFYVGVQLIVNWGLPIENMLRAIYAISFATMGAGNNQVFAGDIDAAKKACVNIFEILDQEDEYQLQNRVNKNKISEPIKGQIQFQNVSFKYKTRSKQILKNVSFCIDIEQQAALVGPSGCGKSTIMQLILRFYDPDSGQILLDGKDIQQYDLKSLRRQIAIVSQEPVLFQGTIAENIRYNLQVSDDQLIDAAKKANAYDFIMKNQFDDVETKGEGFEKQVGSKGSQISGGQKQRIALARALLRQSNFFLFDEATSALDSEVEKQVLDNLRQVVNKTSLTIAHRFSTIKNCDNIFVLIDGKIVEQGQYQKLIEQEGYLYQLEKGIIEK